MNLATYLTAKPYPITHGRLVLADDPIEDTDCNSGLMSHHKMRSAILDAKVLNAMTREDMTVTEISVESGIQATSVRRTLERNVLKGLVSVKANYKTVMVWTKA